MPVKWILNLESGIPGKYLRIIRKILFPAVLILVQNNFIEKAIVEIYSRDK